MSELLPCPFCGGDATVIVEDIGFRIVGCKTDVFKFCPHPSTTVYPDKGVYTSRSYSRWNQRSSNEQ